MMTISLTTITESMIHIVIICMIGFFLIRKQVIDSAALSSLSRIIVDLTLPLYLLSHLIAEFSFSRYQYWWLFPLISLGITVSGYGVGSLVISIGRIHEYKKQVLSLCSFQNAAYLPLSLIGTLVPESEVHRMVIYISLFLLGFNLVIWSLGVSFLRGTAKCAVPIKSFLNLPVCAIIIALGCVSCGIHTSIPHFFLKPAAMLGQCTIPLSLLVVGGNLALMQLNPIKKGVLVWVMIGKLILLPVFGLLIVRFFDVDYFIGLLIMIQMAMPSAVSLGVIIRRYSLVDDIVSNGILISHVISIITIPLFISVYNFLCG